MTFIKGQWNALCDRCGQEFKSGRLRKEYTGLMVCHGAGSNGCFEVRHPNERQTVKHDREDPPWTRPDPTAPPEVWASPDNQPQSQDDL